MNAPSSPAARGAPSYHVVLIGIDVYSGGVNHLNGCVNDIDAIQEVLLRRLRVPEDRIKRFAAPLKDPATSRPLTPKEEKPTRANVLEAFESLGADVKPGDRVFIYYSGHGMRIPEVIDQSKKSHYYREALVMTDYGVEGEKRLLFDWELNRLLGVIAEKTSAVTVVLDCCHSAGATREVLGEGVRARFAEPPRSLVLPPDIAPPPETGARGVAKSLGAGGADIMVVAACLDSELAKESFGRRGSSGAGSAPATGPQPRAHGALTRALLEQLESITGDDELSDLRWGKIWRAVAAGVEKMAENQHPWLSSNPVRRVFGGPPEQGDVGYSVTANGASGGYRLNAGSLVDVTEGAVVALYPPLGAPGAPSVFPLVGTAADDRAQIGRLRVTSSDLATAVAKADPARPPPSPLNPGVRGRLIAAGKGAKLAVALDPPDEAMAKRLATSSLLEITEAKGDARVKLVQLSDRSWAITDGVYGTGAEQPPMPTLPPLPNAKPAAGDPDIAINLMEQYYRYTAPLRLAAHCPDLPNGLLQVKLLDCEKVLVRMPPEKAQNPDLPPLLPDIPCYNLKAGRYDRVKREWITTGDFFCVLVENSSDFDLWVTLLNCDSDGRVRLYAKQQSLPAKGRAAFWAYPNQLGEPIGAVLAEDQSIGVDYYVAIATTDNRASLEYLAVETSFAEIASGAEPRAAAPRGAAALWTSAVAVVRMAV